MPEDNYTRSSFQYILYLWILPLLMLAGAFAIVYVLSTYLKLSVSDRLCGFAGVLAFFAYKRFIMGIKWLKRPEGEYYYLGGSKTDATDRDKTFAEPAFYEKEFTHAWSKQFLNIIIGVFLIALSWAFLSKTTVIMPLIIFLVGLLFLLKSVNAMRSGPVIKVAKEGIWTKESAFLPWRRIRKITVSEEQVHDSVYHYLEIHLKSDDNDTFPDYKLQIDELSESEDIKKAIASFKPRPTR